MPKKSLTDGRKCGATKTKGDKQPCQLPAGYGTDHPGFGKCKWHWGSTESGTKAAARQEVEVVMATLRAGQPEEVDPAAALLQEVYRTAGVVAWFEAEIARFEGDITYLTEQGFKPRAYIDVWQKERSHLAVVCSLAIKAGIAERAIKIEEEKAALFAQAIRGILKDLELSPEQEAASPNIVRKHLMALPAGA